MPSEITKSRKVRDMSVTQSIHGYGQTHPQDQSGYAGASEYASLAIVAGFLDAALRMWDDDRIQAKSRIKVAAAMLRDYADESTADGKPPSGASDAHVVTAWQMCKVKGFIDSSLGSTIRLRDCARQAGLSASYFSCTFKAMFGVTVCHYIRGRRIERSQQLMLLSKERLSQIALACGFADQAHYCRVFRDLVGLSPNVWRRRNMNLAQDE
jgi:AraC family transcriptional regulator